MTQCKMKNENRIGIGSGYVNLPALKGAGFPVRWFLHIVRLDPGLKAGAYGAHSSKLKPEFTLLCVHRICFLHFSILNFAIYILNFAFILSILL
jgi:hypothetical protein